MIKATVAIASALLSGMCLAAPESIDLSAAILAAENSLYRAAFDDCNADDLSRLVTDDLEFFHDKRGQVANSKAHFVGAIRGSCENRRVGKEVRTRRIPEQGSFRDYRMGDFGALATATHRFFHLPEGKPAVPTKVMPDTSLNLTRCQEPD
jgi:hypothetical protein